MAGDDDDGDGEADAEDDAPVVPGGDTLGVAGSAAVAAGDDDDAAVARDWAA